MRKTFVQGGSVKVFVIVGVILAALALTTLYFVGRNFYSDQVPPMVVPESSSDQGEGANGDEGASSPSTDDEGATAGSESDEHGDEAVVSGGSGGPGTQGDSATSASSESAENLPQTGPGDDLVASIALVALTVSTASYIGSVRHLRSS